MGKLTEQSVGRYWFCVRHLLLWADEALLTRADTVRPTFPAYILNRREVLAPATVRKILQTSQCFLRWAKLSYTRQFRDLPDAWIDTLRPPRLAEPVREHRFVSFEDVLQIARLEVRPDNLPLRRDQAGAVMLYLSGMRASALGSLPIAALDIAQRSIRQWTSLGMRTKNSKSATTYLLPIPELMEVAWRWDSFVRERLPPTAMWYTPLISKWGEHGLSPDPAGINRHHAVGRRLRRLFAEAGLPFQSAHKFRHGHAVWALQHAETMADYKAISQNLMHGDIRITDGIYASLLGDEVQQRIAGLDRPGNSSATTDDDLAAYMRRLSKGQLSEALHILADELAR